MIKKIFLFLVILITFSNCGFSPISKKNLNLNYNIIVEETQGDAEINNLIKIQLENYSLASSDKKLFIIIRSDYDKEIIGKDAKGNASDFRLKINSNFTIIKDQNNKQFFISKNFVMKKLNQNFQQLNYENEIKKNLTKALVDELMKEINFF